ncbi:hypothetical protein M758_4G118100 [Ceratodon purpureus]|uniref:Uncharacterized protein n=1 Tax=Ceratodon purpureus TaxID=3225 RepID=A0A8T0IA86_CERPU|nr:hypothetical protein KC19_4G117900 [Ceratodon purpureus]KAG0619113.1 hypothetical protein M758_4G118100 [Ceratodon purpureus]
MAAYEYVTFGNFSYLSPQQHNAIRTRVTKEIQSSSKVLTCTLARVAINRWPEDLISVSGEFFCKKDRNVKASVQIISRPDLRISDSWQRGLSTRSEISISL